MHQTYSKKEIICAIVIAMVILLMTVIVVLSAKYQIVTVASPSMEPVLMTGDTVIIKKATASECWPGDIIVYTYPKTDKRIIHRVMKRQTYDKDGKETVYLTVKGDANINYDSVEVEDEHDIWIVACMPNKTLNGIGNALTNHKDRIIGAVVSSIVLIIVVIQTRKLVESKKERQYEK